MPLRVLIVAPSAPMLGGQAVQAVRLCARLREEPSLQIDFLPINPRLPRPLGQVKYLRTVATSLLYGSKLLDRVRACDIVHVFSASYFSFLLATVPAVLAAKRYGKKVIINYRSGEAEDHLRRWSRTALPALRAADAVVAPSGYLVDVFARFGLRARAIFNIVDTECFRFRERRPLRPVFLSNRGLEPLYNVGCILRAFALVQRRVPGARLTVAGDGSQRGPLERLARDLELRGTSFLGRIPPEQMAEVYDAADLYLNSPDIDNMPGSILEAFACGLPVVTTDAGGIPFIVTHEQTGLLVPRGDHEALAASALRLLDDSALAALMASRARNECRKYHRFTVGREWLALYDELACGTAPAAFDAGFTKGN